MQTIRLHWKADTGWNQGGVLPDAHLVLVFADNDYFHTKACFDELRGRFPVAHIVGCSSAGNVDGIEISDGDVVATAVRLDRGKVRLVSATAPQGANTRVLANGLMAQLQSEDLRHVLVFSEGLHINGSELALGLNSFGVPVSGGLAGDGERFGSTWVMSDGVALRDCVALLGIFGDLQVICSHGAGWTEFGAERIVTRSIGNVVSEIDGQPALALYKKYLGEMAKDLPSSGMRFPLSIRLDEEGHSLIRTLLAVSEQAQSLTFAGDVPQGSRCKLMRTNLESLIESAGIAATESQPALYSHGLCLVVSCVGRRIVLGQIAEEELEAVQSVMGGGIQLSGFYSYGELAPFKDFMKCSLHNQTMSLTLIQETTGK